MKKLVIALILIVMIIGVLATYITVTYQPNQTQQVEATWPVGEPEFFLVDSSGKTLTTSDGQITLQIPSGALTNQTYISIYKYEDIAIPGFKMISAFRFMPEGISFLTPATLSIKYNPNSLPSDLNEAYIRLYVAQDNRVEELQDSFVDSESHVVSGEINHFSMVFQGAREFLPNPKVPLIVGRWSRLDGADRYCFYPGGYTETTLGDQTYHGHWVKDGSDGYRYTLNWEHSPPGKASFIDYVTVAEDGKSYSGFNNYNNSIHCVRESNSPPFVQVFTDSDLGPFVGSTIQLSLYKNIRDPDPDDYIEYYQWVVYSPDGKSIADDPNSTPDSGWHYFPSISWEETDYEFYAEKAGYYHVTARVMDRLGAIGEDTITLIITPHVEIEVKVRKGETAAVVDFIVTNYEDKEVEILGFARLNAYDPNKQKTDPGYYFEAFRTQTEPYKVPARETVTITAQGLPGSDPTKWNPMVHPVNSLYWNAKVDGIWYQYYAMYSAIDNPITLGE